MKIIWLSIAIMISGLAVSGQNPPSVVEKNKAPASIAKLVEVDLAMRICAIDPEQETCKGRNPAKEAADLYAEILKDPEASKFLLASVLSSYNDLRSGARGAVQVSQAADEAGVKMQMILIAQNQRIIELLEQVVKKRP